MSRKRASLPPPPAAPPPPAPVAASPPPEEAGPTVLAVLRDIQAGTLHASNLAVVDRQRCVEHMSIEGYSTAEIAEVMKVAERTIIRDRKAIRAANALRTDPNFVAETIGTLVKHAEASIARLRRIARERDTPPAVKVDAERVGWEVARDLVQSLQRLGYLPTAAHEIRGELTHRVDDQLPSLDELAAELARIEGIATESVAVVPADVIDRLTRTKDSVTRLTLADTVERLAAAVSTPEQSDDPT